jgi:hypothetical protein
MVVQGDSGVKRKRPSGAGFGPLHACCVRTSRGPAALLLLACTAASGLALTAGSAIWLRWTPAGPDGAAEGWKPQTFSNVARHTRYEVVSEDGTYVVRAQADASASGLIHPLDLDAREHRVLRWRWKVGNLIDKADLRRKDGDDYPARIYVAFAYDPRRASLGERLRYEAARVLYGEYPPYAGLNYVWDGKSPVGTSVRNVFTDRVHMIVVESGPARLQKWVEYERDVYADYREAFGEEPPRISGVAIMTDTDGTGERAVAWYGDISLSSR